MFSKLPFFFLPLMSFAGVLNEAVARCDLAEIQQMIAARAPVSEMDGALDTPLHVAIRAGKAACVYLLLAASANPYPPNRAGDTPALLARRYPAGTIHDEMSFLLERPEVARQGLAYAVQRGSADIARLLLEAGLDPNEPDSQGSAPLHHAALRGDAAVIDVLLSRGAKTEVADRDGFLPLHLAALSGNEEAIRTLLAHGAKVSALTRETHESALHIAAAWGRIDVVRVLLASGANALVKDAKGRIPLDRAMEGNFEDVVRLWR